VDANSVGEIEVGPQGRLRPSQIVFTGVGKTPTSWRRAVALEVKAINVESAGELDSLEGHRSPPRRVRPRVGRSHQPGHRRQEHPHISTV
jgi:diaminopimelate decarboxylase